MENDILFMTRALDLAEKGRGKVSPNPMVGCVLVKKNRIVAEGWHEQYGQEHAEIKALQKIKFKATGMTMYVTLEPCCHWGQTPPCVDVILSSGIRRIVVAMKDPNPQVAGKSLRKMKQAGIIVEMGLLKQKAQKLNEAFIKGIQQSLPFVTAKIAQTLDGKTATSKKESKWITSQQARDFSKQRRDSFDAILVGINTVLMDNPFLKAPQKTLSKVIVDSTLRIPLNANLFKNTKPNCIWVATTQKAPLSKRMVLEKKGIGVIVCPQKHGKIDLKILFQKLAEQGIQNLLIEGGAQTVSGALLQGVVDVLDVFIAPHFMGDAKAQMAIEGFQTPWMKDIHQGKILETRRVGEDIFLSIEVLKIQGK